MESSYLLVPHKEKLIKFAFPLQQPREYEGVGESVLKAGLKIPTAPIVASFLGEIYNVKNPNFYNSKEAEFVRKKVINGEPLSRGISSGGLFIYNRNLYTPINSKNAGVYVQYDNAAKGMRQILNVNDLEELLSVSNGGFTEKGVRFSKDGLTTFAPLSTMDKEGFLIATFGVEGAEKFSKVSHYFADKPFISLLNNKSGNFVQTLSSLFITTSNSRSLDNDTLRLEGCELNQCHYSQTGNRYSFGLGISS